jgi:hypothetical protein
MEYSNVNLCTFLDLTSPEHIYPLINESFVNNIPLSQTSQQLYVLDMQSLEQLVHLYKFLYVFLN